MATVTVVNHLTLDGVMQAPGRADEDTRGGFTHGGWAGERSDQVMVEFLGARMTAAGGSLLLGRRTFVDLAASWGPHGDSNPMASKINSMDKLVASRTLTEPLGWNATLLDGDAVDAVAGLKGSRSGNLTILGSGELVRALMGRRLIDELTLMIHPIVFGTGRRLFEPGTAEATLRLQETHPTTTGVIIAVYVPA